ncbi:MAG TPA: DUF2062 domain-containing protein [Gammaproteobacteria bacterium]|nr:DUF2062 domain-containing protein [Gammaproteobacteria bacterium]
MSLADNRLTRLILGLLRQGITPHKIALTLVLGVLLGVIPLIGASTTLCALAALALGLNLPLIQLVNYLVYPLQILLLIPFVQAGQWLFRQPPLPFSLAQIKSMMEAGLWKAIVALWDYAMHGLVAWLILGAVCGLISYAILLPLLKRAVPET